MTFRDFEIVPKHTIYTTPIYDNSVVLEAEYQCLQSPTMAQIYWKTYTQMFAALIFGILLAVGHHMFYSSLSGKPVDTNSYQVLGAHFALSKQEVKIAIGTLFAFLVKAALVLAVAIAYTQVVWKAVKRQETSLLTVDTLFSILGNVSSFFCVAVWWKYPLLLLLAITVW